LPEVRRIGLTGGIATGKSHVRARFEELGVPTIDADTLSREAVMPGSDGLTSVVGRFGSGVLDESGALNRRALAAVIFADPAARHDLEAIIHPIVRKKANDWFRGLDPARHPFAIADIPLLFETGGHRDYDKVIVTACAPETQVKRVIERDGIGEAEARQRLAAQLPIEEKVRRADYVIRTDGSFEETDRQVRDLFDLLSSTAR